MSIAARPLLLLLALTPILVAVERPSLAEIQAKLTVHITEVKQIDAHHLHLRWDRPNEVPSDGIKVVMSTTTRQPIHGAGLDQYVHWVAGTGHTSLNLPIKRIYELSGGQPCWLRLVFVHQDGHEDPRLHVAYSSVIRLELGGGPQQDHRRLAERPRHDGPVAERIRERMAAATEARHDAPAPRATQATAAAPAVLPKPAELAKPDLGPAERDVVEAIYELEQRKLALEQRLAQLEQRP